MSLQGDLGGYDASPGGPNDGSSKGTSTKSKSKQRAANIMTGKVNVTSPTGVTEGYKGPAPTGQNKFGDFVGPGYKGKVGGFDDKGIFSTSLAPTTPKGFNWKGTLFNAALFAINPALAAKYGKAKTAYNAINFASEIAQTLGITDTNVAKDFVENITGNLTSKGKTTSKTNNNKTTRDGDGIGSTPEMAALRDEYYLLLQKLQTGNIVDAERNRLTALKNLLRI